MARDTRKLVLAAALALLVVAAGCSGSGGDAQQATAGGDPGLDAEEAQTVDTGDTESREQSDNYQVDQREVIRTGTVAVEVESYDDARENLTQATRELGGFVGDSSQQVHTRGNRTWTTGEVVLRVPQENFSALLSQAKETGELQESNTEQEDVTDQLVDVEARLSNLRVQRDQLRDLYEEANDTEDVLAVQERLSEVQSEIERLEAQRESLRRQVAYSTITVELNEPRPEREDAGATGQRWHETELISAFVDSVHGVGVVLRGLAVAAAYGLPYVAVFGVPIGGAYALWRRRSGSGPTPAPTAEQTPQPAEDE